MDGTIFDLAIFLVATFTAALVAGLAGFAFGLVAAAAWLHILSPLQTATLIIGYGLIVQGISVWKLRAALSWHRLRPFIAGSAVGVPIGVFLLTWAEPAQVRAGAGVILVAFGLYGLARPTMPSVAGGVPADIGIGAFNGVLGGLTGLAGILITIWTTVRGWPKDQQRTVFQPVAVATFAMSALWIGIGGAVTWATVELFLLGLPALLIGTWTGINVYGLLSETAFRRFVLILLVLSGGTLILPLR